ncbi:hypothetical protein Mgra_00000919 [Meloidogyne graminicola]|uniref:Uncharacterized protein n=1 Tax=Meloidogyne graminicola TaxID=189291 RepID=A0A8T0A216_9BILA|nr:hypothetical protein Mgra_00000919 [Meloidogyne graminicola]
MMNLKKWEFALNNNIPLYLNYNEPCKAVINLRKVENKWFPEDEPEENMIDENGNPNKIRLRLPCFPKNIKEMFIIRYWLDKLFNCTFENSEFDNIIINSAMKFVDFTLCQNIEQHYNILLNILNEGDKFPRVKINFQMKPSFFELIKNHLKTSTNCSNFVSKFEFNVYNYDLNYHNIWTNDDLHAMAEKTKECNYYGKIIND